MKPAAETERFELAGGVIAFALTCTFAIVLCLRHMSFAWRDSLFICALIALVMGVSVLYRTLRRDRRIAHLTFSLALLLWSACVVGGVTLAALGWRVPLADATLAHVDHAIGFPTTAFIAAVSHHPAFATLCGKLYQISDAAVIAALIALTLLGRIDRVAELGFLFVATIALCAVVGVFAPAYGTFTYLHVPPDVREHLPAGAGVYYMREMMAYRSGLIDKVSFRHLMGVITFPSFHTCMVLITCYAFRRMGWIFWGVIAFNVLVSLSIMPIGGHYMTDVLGGIVVTAIAIAAAGALRRVQEALAIAPSALYPNAAGQGGR
jgi:hypothetical protein